MEPTRYRARLTTDVRRNEAYSPKKNTMSGIEFEVWASAEEAADIEPILRQHGLDVTSTGPLRQRAITPTEATVVLAISGAVIAVARAFEAYFKNRNKRLGAGTDAGNIYAENYTLAEVERIIRASKHIFITDKRETKGPNDA